MNQLQGEQAKVEVFQLQSVDPFAVETAIGRLFEDAGYKEAKFNDGADIYVINTCSVTENADKRFKTIVKQAQKANPNAFIAAVGCYAQLKPQEPLRKGERFQAT